MKQKKEKINIKATKINNEIEKDILQRRLEKPKLVLNVQ